MSPSPDAAGRGLVSIVVPAKNEAAAIKDTIRALPVSTLKAMGFDVEIVILDGNSTDGTGEIARSMGASVLTDRLQGKGAAFREARQNFRGDYVVMLDADGTYAADAIPRVLDPLTWGEADVVMGTRRAQPLSMTGSHRIGNVLLSLGARLLYGQPCPDLCTGLWGFRNDALRDLPLQSQGFELEAELFSMASRLNLRISHVPVDYLPRKGIGKLSGGRDGIRIGWCLLRTRVAGLHQGASRLTASTVRTPAAEEHA